MTPNRPRCLALVTSAWPLGALPNGIVSYTARLVAALRELDVRPVVLAWKVAEGHAAPDVIDIRERESSRGLLARAAGGLRGLAPARPGANKAQLLKRAFLRAVKNHPLELLQMEEAFGLPSELIRQRRLPVIVRLHGPWFLNGVVNGVPQDDEFRQRVDAEGKAIAEAAAITAPSLDVLNRTRAQYGLPLDRAAVIPNPIDLDEFREVWSLDGCQRNRIAFIGRFDRHKGADVLIDAFARLAASRPEVELDFIGPDRGVLTEGGGSIGLAEYLEQKLADGAIRSRVHVHGPRTPTEIQQLRRRALVTVIPSRYETFGNTALEALAAGCPVVASSAGGLGEIVKHEETGLLARAEDSAELAHALGRLLDDPQLAARLGRQARSDVATRFDPRMLAGRTLDFYAEVLAQSAANGGPRY